MASTAKAPSNTRGMKSAPRRAPAKKRTAVAASETANVVTGRCNVRSRALA